MPTDDDPAFPPVVLTFAASDPSGGAGLQADILTLAAMGCHPLSVMTALTVQDTTGVEGLLAIDSDWVADQARALLEDIPVDAFRIGVLGSVENIAAIAEIISDYPDVPLVCRLNTSRVNLVPHCILGSGVQIPYGEVMTLCTLLTVSLLTIPIS